MQDPATRPPLDAPRHVAEPVIGDYALIGDCRTAALVSRDGAVDWLCLPHFSGASVFAGILDRDRGGSFSIRPAGGFRSSRRYIPETAVLETTFACDTGVVRLTDLMPVGEGPAPLQPMRELLRVVEGVEGSVEMEVRWEPRPDYARAAVRIRHRGALGFACAFRDELFLLRAESELHVTPDGAGVSGAFTVKAGGTVSFSLSYVKGDIAVCPALGTEAAAPALHHRVVAQLGEPLRLPGRLSRGGDA